MTTDHGAIHSRCPIDQTRVFETHIHMCVWNIWTDVKLLPDDVAFCARVEVVHAVQKCQLQTLYGFHFKHQFWASGQWISFHPLPNEDGGLRLWYRDWSSRRTCNFPIFRQWQPAKPRTGMSFFNIFQHFSTFFNIFNPTFNLMSVRFPQSVGEVNLLPTRAMEKFRFDSYSSLLSNSILSGLTGVFLHVRCIPHQ